MERFMIEKCLTLEDLKEIGFDITNINISILSEEYYDKENKKFNLIGAKMLLINASSPEITGDELVKKAKKELKIKAFDFSGIIHCVLYRILVFFENIYRTFYVWINASYKIIVKGQYPEFIDYRIECKKEIKDEKKTN